MDLIGFLFCFQKLCFRTSTFPVQTLSTLSIDFYIPFLLAGSLPTFRLIQHLHSDNESPYKQESKTYQKHALLIVHDPTLWMQQKCTMERQAVDWRHILRSTRLISGTTGLAASCWITIKDTCWVGGKPKRCKRISPNNTQYLGNLYLYHPKERKYQQKNRRHCVSKSHLKGSGGEQKAWPVTQELICAHKTISEIMILQDSLYTAQDGLQAIISSGKAVTSKTSRQLKYSSVARVCL